MLQFIVVHDSDEVHNVYAADDEDSLLDELKESKWWEDITERLENLDISEQDITLNDVIVELHHDGDSEVGYTLK